MRNILIGMTAAVSLSVTIPAANADTAPLSLAASTPVTSAEMTGSVPAKIKVSKANTFNRLLKKIKDPNAAPADDGLVIMLIGLKR